MRRFIRRLILCLDQDDLFLRVVFFFGGVLFGGLGVLMSAWGTTHDLGPPLYFRVIYWVMAALLTAWGGFLLSRCVVPKRSRIAQFLDKFIPDAVGLEEAAFLLIAIYLPAVLITLLLRSFGVRGE
jgi:hypothetical protein